MVSKRQRLAKKRYREEHPDQFPKPEPTAPKDPDKKKKKKMSKFKRKKSESNDPNKPFRKGFTKHPLRVPGMKPGESCYICKAKEHIAKHCPDKAQWEKNKVCFFAPILFHFEVSSSGCFTILEKKGVYFMVSKCSGSCREVKFIVGSVLFVFPVSTLGMITVFEFYMGFQFDGIKAWSV